MYRLPLFVIAFLGASSTLAPTPLRAAGPDLPGMMRLVDETGVHEKKAATLDGTVSAVDYAANTFVIDVAGRGKVTVIVKPSTDFEGTPGYHSITDVVRGASVSVLSSVVGEKTFAEIVTLRPSPQKTSAH